MSFEIATELEWFKVSIDRSARGSLRVYIDALMFFVIPEVCYMVFFGFFLANYFAFEAELCGSMVAIEYAHNVIRSPLYIVLRN